MTLEERADAARDYCEKERENAIGREQTGGWYFPSIYRSGYVKGATEQQEVDIELAVNWLVEHEYFGCKDSIGATALRKAMKGGEK